MKQELQQAAQRCSAAGNAAADGVNAAVAAASAGGGEKLDTSIEVSPLTELADDVHKGLQDCIAQVSTSRCCYCSSSWLLSLR